MMSWLLTPERGVVGLSTGIRELRLPSAFQLAGWRFPIGELFNTPDTRQVFPDFDESPTRPAHRKSRQFILVEN